MVSIVKLVTSRPYHASSEAVDQRVAPYPSALGIGSAAPVIR
jgi:hypothetical protein